MNEYVIGRAPGDRYDHMIWLQPGVKAGAIGPAQCGKRVVVLNNGDALYAWDLAEPGPNACPKCHPARPPVDLTQEPRDRLATPPHQPPHRPRP